MNEQKFSGYVRPVVTLAFTMAFCLGFWFKMIGADVFVSTATMVIVYWFKSREDKKQP